MSRALRRQEGESLVELLLAVALLGTTSVSVLAAFGTLVKSSDVGRRTSAAATRLTAAAQAVADNGRVPFLDAFAPDYDPAVGGVLPDDTVTEVAVVPPVRFWDGSTFTDQCSDEARANRLQLLTVRVRTASGEATVEVVKRG